MNPPTATAIDRHTVTIPLPATTRELPPAPVLERRADGCLWLVSGSTATIVTVVPSFPWSEPRRFLSLRNEDLDEVGFVTDLAELDADSRRALEDFLFQAQFVFEVTGVDAVEEEVEIRTWKVRTAQGDRSFQTRLDEWLRAVPGGELVMRDLSGDLYRFSNYRSMDRTSRRVMEPFVD